MSNNYSNQKRGFNLIFTLIYPAVLGTFLLSLIPKTFFPSFCITIQETWGWLVALYFTTQHVEHSVDNAEKYNFPSFLVNLIEVILLIYVFIVLGLFADTPSADTDWQAFFCLMTFVILLPILKRFLLATLPCMKSEEGYSQQFCENFKSAACDFRTHLSGFMFFVFLVAGCLITNENFLVLCSRIFGATLLLYLISTVIFNNHKEPYVTWCEIWEKVRSLFG